MTAPVLELADVSKGFGGLRPLRIERLTVCPTDCLALMGLDRPMAEVFVGLVTGASVPDRGQVTVLGRATSALASSEEWLALLDSCGIVSERAVLLDALTPLQNLAVPLTLDLEPLTDQARARAAALAREVRLPEPEWTRPVALLDGAARTRIRLGRALALDPRLVVLEHPSATIGRGQATALGEVVRSVARSRAIATITLTADPDFAAASADRILTLDPSSGRLSERRRSWRFGRRLG